MSNELATVGEEGDDKVQDGGRAAQKGDNNLLQHPQHPPQTGAQLPTTIFVKSPIQPATMDAYYGGRLYQKAEGAEMVKDTDQGGDMLSVAADNDRLYLRMLESEAWRDYAHVTHTCTHAKAQSHALASRLP